MEIASSSPVGGLGTWQSFTCQISLDEIESSLKYFKKDKAPGPDGWLVKFYLAFYDILGPELLELVETSQIEGRVSPSLNSTFIALMHKKENPSTFSDFRPISLCNLVYKLIDVYVTSECILLCILCIVTWCLFRDVSIMYLSHVVMPWCSDRED